jgi:hypothetical protein
MGTKMKLIMRPKIINFAPTPAQPFRFLAKKDTFCSRDKMRPQKLVLPGSHIVCDCFFHEDQTQRFLYKRKKRGRVFSCKTMFFRTDKILFLDRSFSPPQ